MSSDNHDEGEQHDPDEIFRFVAVCKECGAVGERHWTREEANGPRKHREKESPAYDHYQRTSHTVLDVNYDVMPEDVQEMLDDGQPENIDFRRVAEAMSS